MSPPTVIRVAALDVDRTLVPMTLSDPLPEMLGAAGLCSKEKVARFRAHLQSLPKDAHERQPSARAATYQHYADLLEGVSVEAVSDVIDDLWATAQARLFGFVPDLMTLFEQNGLTPMLISNGPEDVVARIAAHLGVERFGGMALEKAGGVYTGHVSPHSHLPKPVRAQLLATDALIYWDESAAMGDSLPDADLFQLAGHSVAFEPSTALTALAQTEGWPAANRENVLEVMGASLSGHPTPTEAAPARHPFDRPRNLEERIREAMTRLRSCVEQSVAPNGSILGRPESRVAEQALMLALLRREKMFPVFQARLQVFLAKRAPGDTPLDAAFIGAVLKGERIADPDALIQATLAGNDIAHSRRKLLSLSLLLAVVDASPPTRSAKRADFDPTFHASWTRLQLLAARILYAAEYGYPGGHEVQRLASMIASRQKDSPWDEQIMAHLVALLVLSRVRPGHPTTREGIEVLARAQNPDGGLPLMSRQELFVTAIGAHALHLSGSPRALLQRMTQYMAAQQQPNGGWAFGQNVSQTDVDTTSTVMHTLQLVERGKYSATLQDGCRFLIGVQGLDGGFPTYVRGAGSQIALTAEAILALAPFRATHKAPLDRATAYLLAAQKADGSFGRSWSLCEAASICRGLGALRLQYAHAPSEYGGALRDAIRRGEARLLSTQNPDGGWGQVPGRRSDAISTSYALMALLDSHHESPIIRRGAAFLLSQQRSDGTFESVSDQSGPRPIVYEVFSLTNAIVLNALALLVHRWH